MKPLIIFFAGPPASGKSEMAYWLSERFYLPIFNTDAVRHDTKVWKDEVDINKVLDDYKHAREYRLKQLLEKKITFIYDASVDRKWPELKKTAEDAGYNWFLIDFDLSRERIIKNREMFDRPAHEEKELVEKWFDDHAKFHAEFDKDAQLHITDDNYQQRGNIAVEKIQALLKS